MNKAATVNLGAILSGIVILIIVIANTTRDVIGFFIISSPYLLLFLCYALGFFTNSISKFIFSNILITATAAIIAISLDEGGGLFPHISSVPILFTSIAQSIAIIYYAITHREKTRNNNILTATYKELSQNYVKKRFLLAFLAGSILHATFLLLLLTSDSPEDVQVSKYWGLGSFLIISAYIYLKNYFRYVITILATLIACHIGLGYYSILNDINTVGVFIIYGVTCFLLVALAVYYYSRIHTLMNNA